MEETLISFKTAELAKDKGFNILCKFSYDSDGGLQTNEPLNKEDKCFLNKCDVCYSAPTQGLLQKWLREKHNLHVLPILNWYPDRYNYEILRENEAPLRSKSIESNYEQALEAGLYEALKLIK